MFNFVQRNVTKLLQKPSSIGHFASLRSSYRFRFFAAISASLSASILFLIINYLLFMFVPSANSGNPFSISKRNWLGNFDLAQFFGTILAPPTPTNFTWFVGIITLFSVLFVTGLSYCLLLEWGMTSSNSVKGMGFGAALFLVFGIMIWLAPGFQPAVMRDALPDVGFFLLGWTGWATVALLISFLLYGVGLGTVYSLFQRQGIVIKRS